MIFEETSLSGAFVIDLNIYSDNRGWFARTYCKHEFESIGLESDWVQMNQSFTQHLGSIRGMHFQVPPFTEVKLVRCIAGSVYDVIIDLRSGSPTFLQWYGVELSAVNRKMIYIPKGFAHGFQTLDNHCEMVYCHSEYFTSGSEGGIRFDDATIGISWPLTPTIVSEKDLNHPSLSKNFTGIKL